MVGKSQNPSLNMMLFTNRNSYEQGRRLGYQGLLQVVVRNQAYLGGGYWKKKKNIRKYKILKSKKKTAPQNEIKKERLIDLNILQANVCGLDKKKNTFGKANG